jgi:hypothetical protein
MSDKELTPPARTSPANEAVRKEIDTYSIIPSSIYTFTRNAKMFEIEPTKLPVTNVPAVGAEPIKKALYKFGFLTANLLQRYMNLRGNKNIKVKKSLNVMFSQRLIWRYTIDFGNDLTHNLDIYRLSQAEEARIKNTGRHKPVYRADMKSIPYAMTLLTSAQWHISMLENRAKEIMYNNRVHISDENTEPITIPSLVRYKTKKRKSVVICAIPAIKGLRRADIGSFLRNINRINEYFLYNPAHYRRYLLILICDSETQIEDISQMLESINETKGIFVLYAINAQSAEDAGNPLSSLYTVDRTDGKAVLTVVDLS